MAASLSFIPEVQKRGFPLPPFDPFVTKFYDVPYAGSKSRKLAEWLANDLNPQQRQEILFLMNRVGESKGIQWAWAGILDSCKRSTRLLFDFTADKFLEDEGDGNYQPKPESEFLKEWGLTERCKIFVIWILEEYYLKDGGLKDQIEKVAQVGKAVLETIHVF